MKGQAWNVVETLKQHDHGPLELTRRTRVCVWDDLVDVPIAIPMRVPSAEISRKKNHKVRLEDQEEEMDIGVGHTSAPSKVKPSFDLLESPSSELPNPNRFDLTREEGTNDLAGSGLFSLEGPTSPATISNIDWSTADPAAAREASNTLSNSLTLPPRPSIKKSTRFSFEFPRNKTSKRPRSVSTRSRDNRTHSVFYEGDDLEGDLGYAAASDMERNRRKVIVERLEAVKSKNPVFTWC